MQMSSDMHRSMQLSFVPSFPDLVGLCSLDQRGLVGEEFARLGRCSLCGASIGDEDSYMFEDAVFCCATHRARAASLSGENAKVGRTRSLSIVGMPPRRGATTGVGLAASHRSWLSLDGLTDVSTREGSFSSSRASLDGPPSAIWSRVG
ncbi:hypothetical protein T492DRAFT_865443 [Pavlovales sp. CCMP2436]|nr:hypothetical protein T492DRAFT_865443 [Pavlovales sp. CCMP2436]